MYGAAVVTLGGKRIGPGLSGACTDGEERRQRGCHAMESSHLVLFSGAQKFRPGGTGEQAAHLWLKGPPVLCPDQHPTAVRGWSGRWSLAYASNRVTCLFHQRIGSQTQRIVGVPVHIEYPFCLTVDASSGKCRDPFAFPLASCLFRQVVSPDNPQWVRCTWFFLGLPMADSALLVRAW